MFKEKPHYLNILKKYLKLSAASRKECSNLKEFSLKKREVENQRQFPLSLADFNTLHFPNSACFLHIITPQFFIAQP